jgi:hypothetical protein
MAATPKGPQKMKLDWYVDRETYDNFIRACSHKGFAPQIVAEKLMKKYTDAGQI